MTKLFHREIHMPARIANLGETTIAPKVTRHATEAALSDRYGRIQIPSHITFRGSDVVEAETVNGALSKVVVRKSYDATRDAIFAIGIDKGQTFLKTVWFNLKSDSHKTLRKEMYARG